MQARMTAREDSGHSFAKTKKKSCPTILLMGQLSSKHFSKSYFFFFAGAFLAAFFGVAFFFAAAFFVAAIRFHPLSSPN
jgi:arginine exporter protein ArgO